MDEKKLYDYCHENGKRADDLRQILLEMEEIYKRVKKVMLDLHSHRREILDSLIIKEEEDDGHTESS